MTIPEQKKYDELLKLYDGHEQKAQHEWFRWKCLTDLYFLAAEIFNLKEAKDKRGRHRLDTKMHKAMCQEICAEGSKLILYPRGSMKTSFIKYRIVQLILTDPMVRIGLWSKTATLVKKEVRSIRNLLANPILRELFPEQIPDPGNSFNGWEKVTDTQLTVWRDNNADHIPQESQVEAWGTEGTVTGHHYDYHFYDDIIDKRSVKTADQIEKTLSWWREMQNVKEVTAEECMTGTRKHQMDIYNTIIRERHFETIIQHKAIVADKPFYSFYTMKDLDRLKRTLGNYDFSLEMMNDPLPEEERMFRGPFPTYHELPEQEYKTYMSVDYAYSTAKTADFCGFAIGKVPVNKPNCIYYIEAFKKKAPPNEIADLILRKTIQYRFKRIGIESLMHQGIQFILDLKFKQWQDENKQIIRPEIYIIPHKIGQLSKADKIDTTLGAFVREQRALFKPDMIELFNQMEFFNRFSDKNDDDILDAVSMLIPTVENFAPFHYANLTQDFGTGFCVEKLLKGNEKPTGSWEARWAS